MPFFDGARRSLEMLCRIGEHCRRGFAFKGITQQVTSVLPNCTNGVLTLRFLPMRITAREVFEKLMRYGHNLNRFPPGSAAAMLHEVFRRCFSSVYPQGPYNRAWLRVGARGNETNYL